METDRNKENVFGRFLNRVGDIIYLNLLWFICCLPIVTIGAATTAAYYVVLHWNEEDNPNIRLNFLLSFKTNWKQATVCWLICAAASFAGMELLRLAAAQTGMLSNMLYACGAFALILTVVFTILVFPILACFDLSIKDVFFNAIYVMFRYLWYTMAVVATVVIGVLVTLYMAPPVFAILGGLLIYLNGCVFRRIFDDIMHRKNRVDETEKENESWTEQKY